MKTETKTYAAKGGAVKAARRAGIAADQIEIVKREDGRFEWKEMKADEPMTTPVEPKQETKPKVEREERNGVKRPKAGGLCAAVWDYLDAHPGITAKELREVAPSKNWNEGNCNCEFYAWRKFNGISGRVKATA